MHIGRVYNPEIGAIQMFLDVQETHQVQHRWRADHRLRRGEAVHTENSFKYDPAEFLLLAGEAGFVEVGCWRDPADWFAVFLLETTG